MLSSLRSADAMRLWLYSFRDHDDLLFIVPVLQVVLRERTRNFQNMLFVFDIALFKFQTYNHSNSWRRFEV